MAENTAPSKGTNGFAIAALITGLIPGLGLLGVIFGFVSLNQLKKSGESGKGLAIAGIILGFAQIVFGIIYMILIVWVFSAATNIITSPLYNNQVQNALNDLNNIQFNFK